MSTHPFDLDELDALWQKRHEPESITQLETRLREARHAATDKYSLLWRAARCSHFRAMQLDESSDKRQAREYFSQGALDAREAMKASPHDVEGCFWRGVNEIEAAQHANPLAALAALKKSTALIERAALIDEAYHFAGPLRVLGKIVHRKPLALGGSAGLGIEYFKRALQVVPGNSTTQIYYAEALMTEQGKSEARRVLNAILSAPDDPNWLWEQARDRRLARILIEKI